MNFLSNIRFVFRFFIKNISSSLIGVLVLTFGLAMAITMFTFCKAVMWNAPTFDGTRLMSLMWVPEKRQENERQRSGLNILDFEEFEKYNTSFSKMGVYLMFSHSLHNPDADAAVKRYQSARVSGNFFDIVSVQPILGRTSRVSDVEPGAERVVLISYDVWQAEYAGVSDVIGKQALLDGDAHTIIGVMPKHFKFPMSQELWIPSNWDWERKPGRSISYTLHAFGALKPGVSIDSAELDLKNIAQQLKEQFPETNERLTRIKISSFDSIITNDELKAVMYSLLIGAIIVLLIACANVSNLLLARIGKRQFELVMRKVLGAKRRDIVTQVLFDAGLIAAVGIVFAFVLAGWACRYIWQIFETNFNMLPYWWDMSLDARVFGFSVLVLIVSILASSLSPLLKLLSKHNNEVLKDSVRTSSGLRAGKTGKFLVGMQITFTTVLLSCALFFVIFLQDMKDRQLPFNPSDILSTLLNVTYTAGYESKRSVLDFYNDVENRITAIPGVKKAAFSLSVLSSSDMNRKLEIEGREVMSKEDTLEANTNIVSNGFFDLFNARPVLGRFFSITDTKSSQPVVIVSQNFVKEFFPGDNPVGKRIRIHNAGNRWEPQNRIRINKWTPWMTIIGVTPNLISNKGLEQAIESGNVTRYMSVYIPQQQWISRRMNLLTTAEGNVEAYIKPISKVIAQKSVKLAPMSDYETLQEMLRREDLFPTLVTQFVISFSFVALIMASVGLYGLVSFIAHQKTREYGIRIALGASKNNVIFEVLRTSWLHLVLGLVLGLAVSTVFNGLLDYALNTSEGGMPLNLWVVYPLVVLIVSTVMLAAIMIPAWRCANIPPAIALHQD